MKDENKTKDQLIKELKQLRQWNTELKESENERKQAEEALRESEEKFRLAFENAKDAIFWADSDTGLIVNCNRAAEILLDKKREEIVGSHQTALHPPERAEYFATMFKRHIEEKGAANDEAEVITKSGEIIPVHITASLTIIGGKPIIQGIFRDITERKQAEEALRERQQLLKRTLDSLHDAVFIIDADTVEIMDCNPAASEIFGYSHDELLGRTTTFLHVDQAALEEFRRHLYPAIEERGFLPYLEFRMKRKDGTVFPTEHSVMPLEDENGSRTGWVSVVRDISERKRAEEALQVSAMEWRASFDAINDTVCLLDPQGRIVRCNKAMTKFLAKPPNQIIGRTCYEVIHGKSEPIEECPIVRMRETRRRETLVLPIGDRWFNVSVDPLLDEADNLIGVVHIIADITERKQAEEELRSSREQLRNLSAHLQSVREEERSRIAREIHDELGQPLVAIKMDLSWLGNKLPKDQRPLLDRTKSITRLIDMTIQRVQRISTELRPVLLDHLGLTSAIEWQTKEFQNRMGITCEIAMDPEDIIMDRDLSTAIFRIFQETLTNVARHANATRVEVNLKEKPGKLELKVRDNGKGITKKQIFDPQSFGLMGIRERVYHWGGQVKISGIRDRGTTVTVSIPFHEERETR